MDSRVEELGRIIIERCDVYIDAAIADTTNLCGDKHRAYCQIKSRLQEVQRILDHYREQHKDNY